VIGILGGGAVYEYVVIPSQRAAVNNKPIAYVGGQVITRGWYNAVVKTLKKQLNQEIGALQQQGGTQSQTEVQQLQQAVAALPDNALTELIGNFVIEQKGPKFGIKVTAADEAAFMNKAIKKEFNNSQSDFNQEASTNGMTPTQYQQFLLMQHYNYIQLTNYLKKTIPKTGVFVDVRHILISLTKPTRKSYPVKATYEAKLKAYEKALPKDHAKAEMVLGLIRSGGDTDAVWKRLAAKYSGDPGSAKKGGDLGMEQATDYVPVFRDASLKWPIGKLGIVHSQFGFHVMEVLKRKTEKLSASSIQTSEESALSKWLAKEEKGKGYVVRKWTPPPTSQTGLGQ
jgi:parvulin-like peptidyl-prolyl isomerase